MSGIWDRLLGDDEDQDYQPRKTRHRQPRATPQKNSRSPRISQQKPDEVSDRVWGMTEIFLDLGKAFFDGDNLPVNRAEFAKRLSAKINSDVNFRAGRFFRQVTSEDDFLDQANDVLDDMIHRFWDRLEAGTTLSGALQMRFLQEDWDVLWYDACLNLRLEHILSGLEKGTITRRPSATPEQIEARRAEVQAMRERRAENAPDRAETGETREDRLPLTDEERAEFEAWVAERKQSRGNVAN